MIEKGIFTHGFLHCRGSKTIQRTMLHEIKCSDPHFWACTPAHLTMYAYMHTRLSIHKTPHPTQRDPARLTWCFFFAISDSNEIPKGHNQSFGRHAVLSQMGRGWFTAAMSRSISAPSRHRRRRVRCAGHGRAGTQDDRPSELRGRHFFLSSFCCIEHQKASLVYSSTS